LTAAFFRLRLAGKGHREKNILKFKLTITSDLFPLEHSGQLNTSCPEEYCFDKNDMQNYFSGIVNNIKVNELINDWKLEVRIYLGGALYDNRIIIYKRGFTYINDKCKEVSIRISLPSAEQISWGINKERFKDKLKIKNEKCKIILVEYNNYKNMPEYIEDNIKKSIKELFLEGITLKKHKIKI
jgi:hypothetical protein